MDYFLKKCVFGSNNLYHIYDSVLMLPSVHILCSPFYPSVLLQSCALLHIYLLFLKLFLFPGSHTPSRGFYFMFNIWQDAGNRTRVAATAARCATNELHTSLFTLIVLDSANH